MSKQKDLHVVIMAGGAGVRFWPASTKSRPKQFLDILGTGSSLLQMTYSRALRLVDSVRVWVVTSSSYAEEVYRQLPDVPHANVLLETRKCNTAPCLAFAAEMIASRYPEAVMLVVPSDHLILDDWEYHATVLRAKEFAQSHDALLTLGITPIRPETGYGYIQQGSEVEGTGVYRVSSFCEKPDLAVAESYLRTGGYLWNSGIFIWRVGVFQKALSVYQPEIFALFQGVAEQEGAAFACRVQEIYEKSPEISLDYAVLEKANNVYVVPSTFAWSDLGSWSSVGACSSHDAEGNAVAGDVLVRDCCDCVVRSQKGKSAVVVGLEGYVVSHTETGLLVCPIAREQEVKQLVADLAERFGEQYL